jgi:hypothetical protein
VVVALRIQMVMIPSLALLHLMVVVMGVIIRVMVGKTVILLPAAEAVLMVSVWVVMVEQEVHMVMMEELLQEPQQVVEVAAVRVALVGLLELVLDQMVE